MNADEIKLVDARLERLRKNLKSIDPKTVKSTDIIFVKKEEDGKDKKVLTKEEFESETFMKGYTKCDSTDDIEVGDYIRYKTKKTNEPVRFLWGGLVVFIDPHKRFLRVKNPYMKFTWSVQLANPDIRSVFYVRKKLGEDAREVVKHLNQDGQYVDITKASSMGLMGILLDRQEENLILNAAEQLQASRSSNSRTYLI